MRYIMFTRDDGRVRLIIDAHPVEKVICVESEAIGAHEITDYYHGSGESRQEIIDSLWNQAVVLDGYVFGNDHIAR